MHAARRLNSEKTILPNVIFTKKRTDTRFCPSDQRFCRTLPWNPASPLAESTERLAP
jgi:hypothetical protein